MPRCADLLAKANNNSKGLRFEELCALAMCHGWSFDRQKGSHHIYKRPGERRIMSFQVGENGKAIAYQVRQLLAAIDATE